MKINLAEPVAILRDINPFKYHLEKEKPTKKSMF